MAARGRPTTANQCRAIKPATPEDRAIIHCQRAHGHPGPHSAGKLIKWNSAYTSPEKR